MNKAAIPSPSNLSSSIEEAIGSFFATRRVGDEQNDLTFGRKARLFLCEARTCDDRSESGDTCEIGDTHP